MMFEARSSHWALTHFAALVAVVFKQTLLGEALSNGRQFVVPCLITFKNKFCCTKRGKITKNLRKKNKTKLTKKDWRHDSSSAYKPNQSIKAHTLIIFLNVVCQDTENASAHLPSFAYWKLAVGDRVGLVTLDRTPRSIAACCASAKSPAGYFGPRHVSIQFHRISARHSVTHNSKYENTVDIGHANRLV